MTGTDTIVSERLLAGNHPPRREEVTVVDLPVKGSLLPALLRVGPNSPVRDSA